MKIGPEHPDLDDVVQETMVSAVASIGRLRSDGKAKVAAWLLAIARHKIADHLRARYREGERHHELGDDLADPAQPVDEVVAQRDRADKVRLALRLLTAEQEEVLILRFVLGFGIEEVAVMTGRPAGAVKSMQHRALVSLEAKLAPEESAWR